MNPRFLPLVAKQVVRARLRTSLTVLGVAVSMFLFAAVQAMHEGVREATARDAADNKLVVYRQNRFCPATSRLPEDYARRIEAVPGVASVLPVQVSVSNCRASLDVVTFRGVPPEAFAAREAGRLRVVSGSVADWLRRTDAALVGSDLARRRGLRPGDRFDTLGITATVAGVFESDEVQDRNVAFVHLPFLQRAKSVGRPGVVTQFDVRVTDPSRMDAVAAAVDEEFRAAQEPTATRSEKAFVASAAGDLLELLAFTRWVGLGCLAAVLALVGNAVVLAVQDRVRDFAVLQTLGYTPGLVARLVVAEGIAVAAVGGVLGTGVAAVVLSLGAWSLSNEGLSIRFAAGPAVWLGGVGTAVAMGLLAGLAPAFRAARIEPAASFRAV
jgi:putative ABC transport system permease protein